MIRVINHVGGRAIWVTSLSALYISPSWDSDSVKITIYSDSIIVYSRNLDSYVGFLESVTWLVADLINAGIPHKGAIAMGKMTLDEKNAIFFGQPLIDSYLLQEELKLYGIIVHHTAEKFLSGRSKVGISIQQYACPLKMGNSKHLTLYSGKLGYDALGLFDEEEEKLQDKIEGIRAALRGMYFETSGHLRGYIENTEAYYENIFEVVIERKREVEKLFKGDAQNSKHQVHS